MAGANITIQAWSKCLGYTTTQCAQLTIILQSKQDLNQAADAAATSATGGRREDAAVSEIDARAGASAAKDTLQGNVNQNVAPEDRERAQQTADQAKAATNEYNRRTKEFLASKMPKERREQVVWRLKKMIVEIQGHADCMVIHSPSIWISTY